MHQNEWFQVWFFKKNLGTGSPSPFPRSLPRFFSGFSLGSGFALNSRALRALDSCFAFNFRLGTLVCPPKVNSWIRQCHPHQQPSPSASRQHHDFITWNFNCKVFVKLCSTIIFQAIPEIFKIFSHQTLMEITIGISRLESRSLSLIAFL